MIKKSVFWVMLISVISPLLVAIVVLTLFLAAYIGILYGHAFQINSLLNEYQKYLYFGGMRAIWQGQRDCVQFDGDLLYTPKKGVCYFNNTEFNTQLNFDNNGRQRPRENITNRHPAVAVVGDSHAMGWGVNDKDTFSYILEKNNRIPVYNFSVSSYGTYRELLRLEKSGILNKIDVIVIQYCDNDLSENASFNKKKARPSEDEFENMVNSYAKIDPLKRSEDWIKVAFGLAYTKVTEKSHPHIEVDFDSHFEGFKNVINHFKWTKEKNIIVIYSNSHGDRFKDFNKYSMSTHPKVKFIDLNLNRDDYFKLDDHLNVNGHSAIAEKLSDWIINPAR